MIYKEHSFKATKPGAMALLTHKCPSCGKGHLFVSANPYNFRTFTNMPAACPDCGLNFNPEIGFYWGATYISYGLTMAFTAFTFITSTLLFGFMNSLGLFYITVNSVMLILLTPVFIRYSRTIWLWMFFDRR